MVDRIIQLVKFPYLVSFRRRRGSKKIHLTELAGEEPISFERVTPAEAPVVFKIVSRDAGTVFEIRLWDSYLWWPMQPKGRRFGVVEFLDGLKSENADSQALIFGLGRQSSRGILANAGLRPRTEAELKAKEMVESTKSAMIAAAQWGAAQILLCGNEVFIQGAEPIYVCVPSYSEGSPRGYTSIRCIDPTLRSDYLIAGVQPAGYLPPKVLIDAGEVGAIFRADEKEAAEEFLAAGSLSAPQHDTIEDIGGRKCDFEPAAFQVASCTRSLASSISWYNTAKFALVFRLTDELAKLSKRDDISTELGVSVIRQWNDVCGDELLTARERGDQVASDILASFYREGMRMVDKINAHCDRRRVRSPFELTEEDEAALAGLSVQSCAIGAASDGCSF
jgi:hypothetical protein